MKTIYYFTADWCAPCKKTRPIVEDLNREQTQAGFQIIDADFEIELVKTFNIRSIPTFILFDNGVEKKRLIGAQTREQLLDLINYSDLEENNDDSK
jgi:thiol-disulfide isomerase/thioredoxin